MAQGKIWTGPFSGPFFGPSFGPFFGPLFGPLFGSCFGLFFGPFFWDHFIGGKHTISTQGRVRCRLLVLREEWKAECHYSGRGERRTIARQGGVGGGCKSKHYLLMELLLNHKFIFIGFFLMTLNVLHFCRHAKAKLPRKHWTSISIENIAFKILY